MRRTDGLEAPRPAIDGWVLLSELSSETEAVLIEGFLENAGIACQIESIVFHAEPVNFGQLARVRVHVRGEDLEKARELLANAQRELERSYSDSSVTAVP